MSTYDDFVETLPMRRKAKRIQAIADGVALAVEANRQLREGRLALDPSYAPAPLTVYVVWLGEAIHGIFRDEIHADRIAQGLRLVESDEAVLVDQWNVV